MYSKEQSEKKKNKKKKKQRESSFSSLNVANEQNILLQSILQS